MIIIDSYYTYLKQHCSSYNVDIQTQKKPILSISIADPGSFVKSVYKFNFMFPTTDRLDR